MFRQKFLMGLAAGAVALRCRSVAAGSEARAGFTRVRLGYIGKVCEVVTITAPTSMPFLNERLTAQLVRFGSEGALAAALNAGTVDAASMNVPSLITALDRDCRMRVTAGLHSGCMRVLVRDAFAFNAPVQLKGQTIGTDRLNGPAMHLLMAILGKAGLDPHREVNWRASSGNDLDSALQARIVNCVAVSDPTAYHLQSAHHAEPFLDPDGGGFSCGSDIATGHQCFLALSGDIVKRRPRLAAALTRAYLKGSAAAGGGIQLADDAVYRLFGAGRNETFEMLASYQWAASTDLVVEELELTARDFQRAGILQKNTDPMALARGAYAEFQDV